MKAFALMAQPRSGERGSPAGRPCTRVLQRRAHPLRFRTRPSPCPTTANTAKHTHSLPPAPSPAATGVSGSSSSVANTPHGEVSHKGLDFRSLQKSGDTKPGGYEARWAPSSAEQPRGRPCTPPWPPVLPARPSAAPLTHYLVPAALRTGHPRHHLVSTGRGQGPKSATPRRRF